MKFSYLLLKQLVPAIKNKNELIERLSLYSFEAEDAGGDTIDVELPPNRFSDAGGHFGLAREISAVLDVKYKEVQPLKIKIRRQYQEVEPLKIKIQDKNLCSRYAGQYFENIKIKPSPKWMQKILISCGMRPINNIVDIMNYAMLETGQPMHAFDYDKIDGKIIVRRAKKGEKIMTLENEIFELNKNILVIATRQLAGKQSQILAIAGIKGGKKAEVDKNTKRIIVEAANFASTHIYKTSRSLGLITDASLRFSRGLSPELVAIGLNRAAELLKENAGVKTGAVVDINFNKPFKKIIKFDIKKFSDFIGLELDFIAISKYLTRLGFKIIHNSKFIIQDSFLVEVPPLRQDIETFEDLCEEVVRLYGYNNLKSKAPAVAIHPSGFEDQIVLKDKIRRVLVSMGLNEVQNNSFISQSDAEKYKHPELVELENPISAEYQYLRPCLTINFIKNIESNSRFFNEINLFEIGNIFFKLKKFERSSEVSAVGIILASKNQEAFFRLKGIAAALFKKIGVVDFFLAPAGHDNWIKEAAAGYLDLGNSLKIELGNGSVIGYLGELKSVSGLNGWHISALEMDIKKILEYVVEEHEYRPLPKYPSIMRDISVWVDKTIRVGDIMQVIQEADLKIIEDVDLIDEYEKSESEKRSLTFRIVFQAEDRTLTDTEVNKIMGEIAAELKKKFKIEVR